MDQLRALFQDSLAANSNVNEIDERNSKFMPLLLFHIRINVAVSENSWTPPLPFCPGTSNTDIIDGFLSGGVSQVSKHVKHCGLQNIFNSCANTCCIVPSLLNAVDVK